MAGSIVAAIVAALCFATAVVFQQEAAVEAHASGSAAGHSIAGLAMAVLRRRVWLLATVVDFTGFVCQATALHLGRLTVVQPLLVLVLAFGMILGAARSHTSLGWSDLLGVLALCVGLAGFLMAAQPSDAGSEVEALPGRLPLLVVSVLASTALAVVAARRLTHTPRALVLGLVAGICFAAVAAIVKQVGGELTGRGVVAVLTDWPVWALAAVALSGLAIEQAAFAAGPLVPTLVVLTLVDPLASLGTGVLVYGENLQGDAGSIAVAALCGVLIVVGAILVARSRATAHVQAPEDILAARHALLAG